MLFSKQDPMDDLLDLIRAKNPAVTQPAAAFAGSGAILQNVLVNRSLNPIVAAAGTIPYGGIAVNPANPKADTKYRHWWQMVLGHLHVQTHC